MAEQIDLTEVPVLEGWKTLPQVGRALNVSRQNAYKMAKGGKFKSLVRLDDSNMLLVSEEELSSLVKARSEKTSA